MLDLKRLDNWRSRYADFMDLTRRTPFVWGESDCAVGFAFGAIEAITGYDLGKEFKGKYASEAQAVSVIAGKGADNLGDFIGLYLPEQHTSEARAGDIGLVPDRSSLGGSLCIFDASGVFVKTEQGHGMLPRKDAVRSFRVGEPLK